MKLVKIKDKYIFKSKHPNREHTYLHYFDTKTKETRLIGTTHIYELQDKKKSDIKKGFLKEYKFKCLYLPSGVKNHYINSDIKGNKLPYHSNKYKTIGIIPNKQAKEIISFARKRSK